VCMGCGDLAAQLLQLLLRVVIVSVHVCVWDAVTLLRSCCAVASDIYVKV